MLYGHTVSALLHPRYQTGTWFDIWIFQRGLTSTLFLLLSGFAFSIATGRHWSSHGQLSLAVLRRIRRFSLFILLGYALHFPVARFADLPYATPERWRSFLAVDILQLIGVTFIGVQILVMLTRSRRVFGWTALSIAVAIPLVQAGKLKALAVTGAERWPDLPDIPTVEEAGVPASVSETWQGVLVPAGTPADVVERLATALVAIAQRPDVREKLRNAGFAATGRGPQAFAKRIADDVPKWKEVIEKARISAK